MEAHNSTVARGIISDLYSHLGSYHDTPSFFMNVSFIAGPSIASENFPRNILEWNNPANSRLTHYIEWHERTRRRLNSLTGLGLETDASIKQLSEMMDTLYGTVIDSISRAYTRHSSLGSISEPSLEAPLATVIESEISFKVRTFLFVNTLSFLLSPDGHPIDASNYGLDPNDIANRGTITQLLWTRMVLSHLRGGMCTIMSPLRLEELISGVEEHQRNITNHVKGERLKQTCGNIDVYTIIHKKYQPLLLYTPTVVMTAMMVISLKRLWHIPDRSLSEQIKLLRRRLLPCNHSSAPSEPLAADPRTYEKVFDLSFEEELLAMCSNCGSAYPADSNGASRASRCSYAGCNSRLNQGGPGAAKARMLFRRRTLDDYIQVLLGREGVLNTVDDAWKAAHGPAREPAAGFFDASLIREMKGPDGVTPLVSFPQHETRLLFSLAVDWYNPFHNKSAGKSASTGVIFMACLNLPPEERYKEENIYLVGVMPGRKQTTRINEIMQPLIKDLLRYWHNGVLFNGIPGLESERLIRCALVQLICDLPAARKVAGFRSHSATFNCSVCLASKNNATDLSSAQDEDLQRTKEDHIANANIYKRTLDTQGLAAAEKLLPKNPHGVRWSCLNDLPYWNPVKCTVLDIMHLLLLGLCAFHWRKFWHGDDIVKTTKTSQTSSGESDIASNESDQSDSDSQSSEGGEKNVTSNDPHARSGKRPAASNFLTPELMRKARYAWSYWEEENLKKLTANQILCLLKENGGELPAAYRKKAELVDSLLLCRRSFSRYPMSKLKLSQTKPTKPLPAGSQKSSHFKFNTSVVWSRSELLLADKNGMEIPHVEGRPSKKVQPYITRDEMDAIQSDFKNIILPSWCTKLTPQVGERSNGKLKAAEWRSLVSIYLPVSCMALWADSNLTGNRMLHLKAILALAIMVNVACATTSSFAGAQLFHTTTTYYLTLIKTLPEEVGLVHNHHLALHISTYMLLHGPCRSHWAFPFERLIGRLQRIRHNSQIGDISGTVSKEFNLGQMLKGLTGYGVSTATASRYTEEAKQQRVAEYRATPPTLLLSQLIAVYGQVASWATGLHRCTVRGVTYGRYRSDSSNGDANIGFITQDIVPRYAVGKIMEILRITTRRTLTPHLAFVVARYNPPPQSFNAYAWIWREVLSHPLLGVHVAGTSVSDDLEIVPVEQLIGHIALKHFHGIYGEVTITLQLTTDLEARRKLIP